MRYRLIPALLLLAACGGPRKPPLPYEIGAVHRSVTTGSDDAQRWFDRGLALAFGFNHDEAIRCFEKAAAADPGCAMAYWGKAYALGPNYNAPEPDADACRAALAALAKAECDDETPAERALVVAMRERFAPDGERKVLDRAYAEAMRAAYEAHPDDPEVRALYAEALMQLRPWKLWSPAGEPAPEVPAIRRVLEAGLARRPGHAALCHLYIHAMEAGPDVARAIPAARALEKAAPGLGHLVHMPSHVYVWTGRYDDVIRTNVEAVRVDDAFALLREAVELDGNLNYDEPWGWMEPARHALGALLTEQRRYEEALAVYRANLARYPENGWALHGMAECLEGLGREDEAREVRKRFERAWARADTAIPGSCFCRTGISSG